MIQMQVRIRNVNLGGTVELTVRDSANHSVHIAVAEQGSFEVAQGDDLATLITLLQTVQRVTDNASAREVLDG